MPRKTRPRIDKKKAVSFRLLPRSQNDPLTADETAPQNVLVEIDNDDEKRKEEQRKYGIYFDDEYNYLKHLKSLDEFHKEWDLVEQAQPTSSTSLKLPSSVFPSIIKEDDGLLNRAALPRGPQLDWDPDIVAALDEDFDYEDPNNQLDDDFVTQAIDDGTGDDGDGDSMLGNFRVVDRSKIGRNRNHNNDKEDDGSDEDDDEDDRSDASSQSWSENDDFPGNKSCHNRIRYRSFNDEETRSVFTNYSMTSSVLARNAGKTLIDDKFERFFAQEYGDDTEIGALDLDEVEGSVDANQCSLLKRLTKEDPEERVPYQKPEGKIPLPRLNDDSDEEVQVLEIKDQFSNSKEDRFDCETILSTYSNLYNHPKLIPIERQRKLKINPITGIVSNDSLGLTKKNLRLLNSLNNETVADDKRSIKSRASQISVLSERPKDESPEERKQRKAAFKQYKQERRSEKKANKLAFKIEGDKHLKELKTRLNAVKLV